MRAAPVLLLVAALVAPGAGAAPLIPDPEPVEVRVQVLAGKWTHSDTTLRVEGALVLAPGTRLQLRNVTLELSPGAILHVQPGAALEARATRFLGADGGAGWTLRSEGLLKLDACEIAYAETVHLSGPGTTGSHLRDCLLRDARADGLRATEGASFLLEGSHVRGAGANGVSLEGSDAVTLRGNLIEDAEGDALVAFYASTTRSLAAAAAGPVLEFNALRSERAAGILLQGGSPTVHGNALAVARAGILVSGDSGARITSNQVLGLPLTDGTALVGLRTTASLNGLTPTSTAPTFEGNRIDGFRNGAQATAGVAPTLRNNSFGDANLAGLETEAPVAARANWWAHASGPRDADAVDGSAPAENTGAGVRVEGSADYRDWLTEDPYRNPLRLEAERASDGLVTVTVRSDPAWQEPRVLSLRMGTWETTLELEPGELHEFKSPAGAEPFVAFAQAAGHAAVAVA